MEHMIQYRESQAAGPRAADPPAAPRQPPPGSADHPI